MPPEGYLSDFLDLIFDIHREYQDQVETIDVECEVIETKLLNKPENE